MSDVDNDKATFEFIIEGAKINGVFKFPVHNVSSTINRLATEYFRVQEQAGQLQEHSDRLKQQADRDFLTGLLNRRSGEELLRKNILVAQQTGETFCVALVDLDHFKLINDERGHAVGDRALRALGQRFSESLRGGDWAARWGGEEFLIVLFVQPDTFEQIAPRLTAPVHLSDIDLRITMSLGYTAVRQEDSFEQILRRADQALYQAKQDGRNLIRKHL